MEKLIVAVMLYLTDQQCNKEAVAVAFLKPSSGRGKRTVHSIHNNVADYHGKVKESYNTCHDDKRVKEMFDDKVRHAWDSISAKVIEDTEKYDEAQCA